jgi:hypothetical protein
MNTTGPAPTEEGETETRALLMYTVRFTGEAGRGRLAKVLPLLPQADRISIVATRIANVVLRIVGLALLSLTSLEKRGAPLRVSCSRTLTDRIVVRE